MAGNVVKDSIPRILPSRIDSDTSWDSSFKAMAGTTLVFHLDIRGLYEGQQTTNTWKRRSEKATTKTNSSTHTVIEDPNTQQRETWLDICQNNYGLSAKGSFMNQNPRYDKQPRVRLK